MDQKLLFLLLICIVITSCSFDRFPAEPELPDETSWTSFEQGRSYFQIPAVEISLLTGNVVADDALSIPVETADRFVYKYYYIYHDGKWEKKSFSGASESDTGWILVGKDTLTVKKLFQDSNGYVVVYSCSSRSCSGEGWKVHQFTLSPESAPAVAGTSLSQGTPKAISPTQPTLKPAPIGITKSPGLPRPSGGGSGGARVIRQCTTESDCSSFHDCINEICVRRQCSDGLDNEGDGFIDWGFASGNDPSCSSPFGNSEANDSRTNIGWNDFPEFNLHSNLTAIYGGIQLSGCYQSSGICVEDVGLAALNKGFSHIAVYENMTQAQRDSIPRAKRASLWGPFGDTANHPVRQEPLYKYYMPWNNNFSVYYSPNGTDLYSPMDNDLVRIANLFSDSNGTGIPGVDILAADVESQLTTDQEIADLRGNSTKALLIPDQFK